MDLIVVSAVQTFDSFSSVPYPYPIPSAKYTPTTLGEYMFAGYFVWDADAKHAHIHVHIPSVMHSRVAITSSATAQVRTADESILGDGEVEFVSVKTFSLEGYR